MGGKESRDRRRQKRAASSINSSTELVIRIDGKNQVKKKGDSIRTVKQKKKIAKPKHLKRKFEQLSQLEGEVKDEMLANLMKDQEALQRQKAKRSIAFEAKIQETVGSTLFNKVSILRRTLVQTCSFIRQLFFFFNTPLFFRKFSINSFHMEFQSQK